MSNEALIDGFKKIVSERHSNREPSIDALYAAITEAIEALEQSQQLISAAEDIGYREACESIGNGVSFLFNALNIDGDDYGQDTAEAESLSEALRRIARGLEPMGITPNDDDGDLQLPIKALEQSEWERVLIERLAVLHILSPEHETNPSKALHDIISYEVLISLDPSVSSDAVALIEKYGGTYPPAEDRDMSDTEQERFYSLAGTVFDREDPIIDDNSYFCCTTPDEAKIAVKMLNTINANLSESIKPLEQSEWVSVDEVVVNKKYLKVVYRASSPSMSLDDNWREAYDYISAVLYE